MQKIILTELGIVVYEDSNYVTSFPFKEHVTDYLSIKDEEGQVDNLIKYLEDLQIGVIVNDKSLLAILKKKSIDAQIMNEEENEKNPFNKTTDLS